MFVMHAMNRDSIEVHSGVQRRLGHPSREPPVESSEQGTVMASQLFGIISNWTCPTLP